MLHGGGTPPVLLRGRGGGGGGGGSGGGGDEGGSAVLFKVFLGVSSDLFERAGAHGFADELRFKNDHERARTREQGMDGCTQWRALSITSERGRFFLLLLFLSCVLWSADDRSVWRLPASLDDQPSVWAMSEPPLPRAAGHRVVLIGIYVHRSRRLRCLTLWTMFCSSTG